MRPESLFPLFAPLTSIQGIGARLLPLFKRIIGEHVVDLLWHLPQGLIDRRRLDKIAETVSGRISTIIVRIERHQPGDGPRRPYKVICSDETGFLTLLFFHPRPDWLEKTLPIGEKRVISGLVENFQQLPQIAHPDHIVTNDNLNNILVVEPVYGLTAGLSAKVMNKVIKSALQRAPSLPEWIDPELKKRHQWPDWKEAVTAIHKPENEEDISLLSPCRLRLAYDELLANQLSLALVRMSLRRATGRSIQGNYVIRQKIIDNLPFSLTKSQAKALDEITSDMVDTQPMLRLLQGDVGSGKTIVALLAMINAVESGCQAAMMAPTETLAYQHFSTMIRFSGNSGLRLALLTGRDKGKQRLNLLGKLAAGEIDVLVGTHALFQDDVIFHDLALAIIDEQHRFGVQQRLDLASKGRAVDMLVMTATPIPRTLTMTAYGDMDVSRLDEKPAGRRPVDTRILPMSRQEDVIAGLKRAIPSGNRIYWVTPLVEESEKSDLAAAEERFSLLQQIFGDQVGLVHGKMKPAMKDAAMADFAEGKTRILVATTVIEVGVDVPEATIMVVEHAERFGLAQLHQLRGRVGRGSSPSSCLLLYGQPLTETAISRLNILRDSEDGFHIAEEDLRLRGAGELLGTKQSGIIEFKVADLSCHANLLAIARSDVKMLLESDPELKSPRGQALRVLLYLFKRDSVVKTLRSG